MAETGSKSRTPSDPSSRSKPPEPLVFFVERSLGRRKVAEALRQAGAAVEVHEDHFPADAKDQEWLSSAGRKRWIVLTKDQRIRYRKPEINALLNAGVAAFVLTAGNLTGDEMAAVIVTALPKIRKFVRGNAPPFIATVTKSARVALLVRGRRHRK